MIVFNSCCKFTVLHHCPLHHGIRLLSSQQYFSFTAANELFYLLVSQLYIQLCKPRPKKRILSLLFSTCSSVYPEVNCGSLHKATTSDIKYL